VIREIIEISNKHNKISLVDPKLKNYLSYKKATLFKPNLKEAESILNREISSDEEIIIAGKELLSILDVEFVVITLGKRGMALFKKSGDYKFLKAKAIKIANVSGAGDTVIATLAVALAAKASVEEAILLSNYAASIVVEDVSIVPVYKDDLYQRLAEMDVIDY